jgi:predicted N-formylglutamate amidohydrolase
MDEVEPARTPGHAQEASKNGDAPRGAVEIFNAAGRAPALVICDHAGRAIPACLGDLGLPEAELARHIGWDIGAADLTYALARELDAPAVLCHVSRLVVDPNREPGTPSSIPEVSDGTLVPANRDLDPAEIRRRLQLSFVPYHRAVARQIARLRRRVDAPAVVSVHSFTPEMGGFARPWQIGILWTEDDRLARPTIDGLRRDPALSVGDNQPYTGWFPVAYSIPFHARRTGLPHVTFEVRQDLVETAAGAGEWARRISGVLRDALARPGVLGVARIPLSQPCRSRRRR